MGDTKILKSVCPLGYYLGRETNVKINTTQSNVYNSGSAYMIQGQYRGSQEVIYAFIKDK